LPPVDNSEDILRNYSTSNIIELSYRMGLLSRPDWRKITRVYDIRRDLEHEDDEYEAGLEDVIYIFKTSIEVVLSKDPIDLIRVGEIKEIVEEPKTITALDNTVVEDYKGAPKKRQEEIYKYLVFSSLDDERPDIVRQNCYNSLSSLQNHTQKEVILEVAKEFKEKIGRKPPSVTEMRIAHSAGILPYLKRATRQDFFKKFLRNMEETGFHWKSHKKHGLLLRNLKEIGGLKHVPENILKNYIEWLILCYIGERGGYGPIGKTRKVFYSNTGAPLSKEIIKDYRENLNPEDFAEIKEESPEIQLNTDYKYVQRRFEELVDLVE